MQASDNTPARQDGDHTALVARACAIPLLLGALLAAPATAQDSAAEGPGLMDMLDREVLLEHGFELPGQWGAALFYSQSESQLPVENLKYGFSQDEPLQSNPLVNMDDLDNDITNYGVIFDYWVLPMLDLYLILGETDGRMDSNVNTFGSSQPLGFNFTGTSYAVGGTLVTPYKQAVLLLDYNYMELDTDVYEEIIPVTNATVRLGWNFGNPGVVPKVAWVSWITTEFQGTFDLKQTVGDGGVDPGTVPTGVEVVLLEFEVEKYDTWALGAQWDLAEHWVLVSELGFDTVESLTFALNYRWE